MTSLAWTNTTRPSRSHFSLCATRWRGEAEVAAAPDEGQPLEVGFLVDALSGGARSQWGRSCSCHICRPALQPLRVRPPTDRALVREVLGDRRRGQVGADLSIDAVWTTCARQRFGTASLMAAREENLVEVAITMLGFGVGTAVPLLILGMLSRELLLRWRGGMARAASTLKMVLGALLVTAGVLTLSCTTIRSARYSPIFFAGLV